MLNTNTIYRYARPYSDKEEKIDSYPNYFYFTNFNIYIKYFNISKSLITLFNLI